MAEVPSAQGASEAVEPVKPPTTHYRGAAFLSEKDEPSNRVRDPIHGFIRYSANEALIIDHPLFQRLRLIRQLALTEYAYPGATHTRFGHSLGVMEIASQGFDSLAMKHGDLLEATFKTVDGFQTNTLAKARQVLRLAALLHDVGHIAFSHAAEGALHGGKGHEALSETVITEDKFLGGTIKKLYGGDVPALVAAMISKTGPPPQLKVLQDIVSGQMDADRTDYLLRDSHYCGVDYGRFDYRRLIDSLDLFEEEGMLEIAIKREGIHTFEALILARYQMSVQVYFHRLRRVYDEYLKQYFASLAEGLPTTDEELLELNDFEMLTKIRQDARDDKLPQHQWAERIANRRHHREVFATGVDAKAEQLTMAKKVAKKLQDKYTAVHMFSDVADAQIHKLLLPRDASDKGKVVLKLIRPYGKPISVANESQLLKDLTTEFQCARIFADVDPNSKLRIEIQDDAQAFWKELGGL